MAAQKILIPYNFKTHDEKSLDFVINNFPGREDVRITLLNTYAPLPKVDLESNPELSKMRSGMVSLSEELKERERALQSTRAFLIESGFRDEQVDYIFKEREKSLAEEIMDIVKTGHYRILVISGKKGGMVNRFLSRSIHSKILSDLADVTICVAK